MSLRLPTENEAEKLQEMIEAMEKKSSQDRPESPSEPSDSPAQTDARY